MAMGGRLCHARSLFFLPARGLSALVRILRKGVDMDQNPLFVTDIYDALGDIVRALGGPKRVAALMRPDRDLDAAATWLKDCLNRHRREHLDPEQVLWLLREGRAAGCHVAMNYLAAHCGYHEPAPLEPEDERARLQREFAESVAQLTRLAGALGIDAHLPASMRVVK